MKTPEQIASEVFAAHDLESVRESSTREVLQMIAEAIEADRAQRDMYTFDEETAAEAGAWKKGERFWGEEAGTYVAGYVDGWRGNRKRVER